MRAHLYDACEKAIEYEKTKSLTTAVECAKALKAWMDRMAPEYAKVDNSTESDDEQ